ncbi:MAG: class I SAM-dependent methyltransferase [Archangium sp.]|nr:class I SAM-dependent methyltransferase [Archangium sp.]
MSTANNPWDTRYSGEAFMYGTAPNDFLREQVGVLPPGGRVLCLAEGEGRNAVFLAGRGFQVTGVDGSKVGLDKAQRLARERGVKLETIVADLRDFDLGTGRWDAIVSIWCHVPPDLRASLHPRIIAALAPGGVFLLEHYHPKQLEYGTGGPPDAKLLVTRSELEHDFAGLTVLHASEGEREIQEGTGHAGKSFVTRFIARR